MKEVSSIAIGIIVWVDPRRDQYDFTAFYIFVLTQVADQKTTTATMPDKDGIRMYIESLELPHPFIISGSKRHWRLDARGKNVIQDKLAL